MFEVLLENLTSDLDAIKRHARVSDALRRALDEGVGNDNEKPILESFRALAPAATNWRVIDHCASVTRVYALFEQYVHELLEAYLSFLEGRVKYQQLPIEMREEHRRELGRVLIDLGKERLSHLTLGNIIKDFGDALSGADKYRLLPEALISHDQNLRLQELENLLSRCGIADARGWCSKHRAVKDFFAGGARESDTVEAELRSLVQYRNDAAHGEVSVSDLAGLDTLLEYADFVQVLGAALQECVARSALMEAERAGSAKCVGVISEVYSDNVAIVILSAGTIKVNQTLYLLSPVSCSKSTVMSLQLDDVNKEAITSLLDREVGVRMSIRAYKNTKVYTLSDLSSPTNTAEAVSLTV